MRTKGLTLLCAAVALAGMTIACSEAPKTPAANGNTAAPLPPGGTEKVEPKIVRDEAGPDNSYITVRQLENGDRIAVRTWENGPVKKVKRRETAGEATAVRVTYRDGSEVKVEDKDTIEHALDWTADQILTVAKKSGRAVGKAAADAEDAGDEAADKAEDLKDATVKGAKKAGSEVADKAEDLKDETVKGAKKAGEKLKP